MKELRGRNALVTGASRGIGVHIARALAAEGCNLVLAARSAGPLEALAAELDGVTVIAVPTDLADPAARASLVAAAEQLGPIDILVNNAGIENAAAFHTLDDDAIRRFLLVNLEAPMLLSRAVLPGMLERDRGHFVHMASIAGLTATAFGEGYGASKHGLVGFHRALRASLQAEGRGVSSSLVAPGFVSEVGMYESMVADGGATSPLLMGTVPPEAVARAVVQAIRRDQSEVVVMSGPFRLFLALQALFPRVTEWVAHRIGAYEVFRGAAKGRGQT